MDDYLALTLEELSLDKIKLPYQLTKRQPLIGVIKYWLHYLRIIKLTLGNTESDETFFLNSEKGRYVSHRTSRKCGGSSKTRGISNDQVTVIVTQDRKSSLDLSVVTMGRLNKVDIEKAIGSRVKPNKTILCSDARISYKGFAIDNKIEHHTLKAAIKQRVKNKVSHIQHVNSAHNKLKKWIDHTFWGVSTKYL